MSKQQNRVREAAMLTCDICLGSVECESDQLGHLLGLFVLQCSSKARSGVYLWVGPIEATIQAHQK